jgi:hypothetical protein
MNDLVRHEIDIRIAGKVYHFRMLFDLDGSEDTDRAIASDLWHKGKRQPHQIYRSLLRVFHDELQKGCLMEEAERITIQTEEGTQ